MRKDKNIEAVYHLSPTQEGMLFHTLYDAESGVYFEQMVCTVRNPNVPAFKQAWGEAISRHPALRTLFAWKNMKSPLQVVRRKVELSWTELDWRTFSDRERGELLEEFLASERKAGFHLNKAPLMRFAFIRMDREEYRFVWNYHHILMDGWSNPVIIKEVFAFYEAFGKDERPLLEPVRPYGDYIDWLRRQDIAKAEKFWRETLKGFSTPTSLTVDRKIGGENPVHKQGDCQEHFVRLSEETSAALLSFTRKHNLTIATLMRAAWGLLLSRYSGESDVVFGVTVSGRPPALPGVESMVGLFINTLPARIRIPDNDELIPWLEKVQAEWAEAELYSYSPLVEIQRWSDIPPGSSLFESIMVLENYPLDDSFVAWAENLGISNIYTSEKTNYPLTLSVALEKNISLIFSYNTEIFDSDAIQRMGGHLLTILKGIVSDPNQKISQLPLLTKEEKQRILVEWNDTKAYYPRDKCVYQLFEEQAERVPENTAVVFEDQSLTYAELNAQSNQLARYLRILGVKPETPVGIFMERSLEMIVGILGILKAGGAYVPLDSNSPEERLSYMLSDMNVSVLLTQSRLLDYLPAYDTETICLDTDWEKIAKENSANLTKASGPDNLAYVIYTSGTTGRPKGVMIQHSSLSNMYWGYERAYKVSAETTSHLQMSNYYFDAFQGWLFLALCSGTKLVLCPYEIILSAERLYKLMLDQSIDCAEFVPAVLRNLTKYLRATDQNVNFMSVLIIGADTWHLKEHYEFHSFNDQIRFINAYGVTEATIDSTYFEKTSIDISGLKHTPIGKPFANTRAYILDSNLNPVPVGVLGELHIGGPGVARGYLNRPELTKEKFIPDPFSDESGSRLYKTGDLGRWLPDGNVEFLGRADNQTKIRGFRIELGEIESALAEHKTVGEVVVTVREDQRGDKYLAAYICFKNGRESSSKDLRAFLKAKLPDYMIPSRFVFLDVMPLNSNNKIDRKALPAPDIELVREKEFIAPRNDMEEALAAIWAEILEVAKEEISIFDNFFELGGHSLMAIAVISKIFKVFKVEISTRDFFLSQTMAEAAELIAASLRDGSSGAAARPASLVVELRKGDASKTPLVLIHPGGGHVYFYRDLAESMDEEQPVYGIRARGFEGKREPLSSVEEMAELYIEELRAFQPQGPYCLGGSSSGGLIAFEMARRLSAENRQVALLALMDTGNPQLAENETQDENETLAAIFEQLGVKLTADELREIGSPEERFEFIQRRIADPGVSAKAVDAVLLGKLTYESASRLLNILMTISKASDDYRPKPYPGKIVFFRPMDTEKSASDKAELGWLDLVEGIETHEVPGNHITMNMTPNVGVMADKLQSYLK